MHRHARLLLSLASFSVVAATGCVQDQEELVVRHAIGFDDMCQLDDSIALTGDTIDVAVDAGFALPLLVANLHVTNPRSNTGLEDNGEIKLEYAEVRLSMVGGTNPAGLESEFEVPIPSDSIESGEEQGVLITVPASVTQSLRGSVGAGDLPILQMSVILVGEQTDQARNGKLGEVRSREYTFPFTLCNGCLAECPAPCGLPQLSACGDIEETTDTTTG